ncbi:MAG: hypothetical protein V3T16_12025 [Gemmatimonadales bacterium]
MNLGVGIALVGVVVLATGCGPNAGAHERLGDQAYTESRFADAVHEYQLMATSGGTVGADLWAKLGAAGLRQPDYRVAADAYRELAATDALRVDEAVQGLDRAARGAERAGDYSTLQAVLLTLRAVAPQWTSGRYALTVMRHVTTSPETRLALLPLAAATASNQRMADSLLGGYADALREAENCDKAIRVYRSVMRRSTSSDLEASMLHGRASCAYALGLEHLPEEPWAAEGWFLEAVDTGTDGEIGRLALIGLGDARAAQGDLIGAALAYQAAMDATSDQDSITIRAMRKLNDIATASSMPDSPEGSP